jgi:hypothetical protein
VQNIHLGDCTAEGIQWKTGENRYDKFRHLWDSINAKRGYGWDVNPQVKVIEFKRIER